MSGSPILIGNPLGNLEMSCVGMLIGSLKTSNNLMVALDGYLLHNIVEVIINNWTVYIDKLEVTDQSQIDNFIRNGYPKAWLGITNRYNHPVMTETYKELSSLSYVGGLLITNFIIGYNVRDNKFVFTSNELLDRNVIKLDGPLLDSKIYSRFIANGNVPIVIKSIIFYDIINSSFQNIKIGKFGGQQSYSRFVYGHSSIASYPNTSNSVYYNLVKNEFGPITIEYYYFDGNIWRNDTEKIGGNTADWYTIYKDNADNKYYQHKFEYPQILIPYVQNYSISKYGAEYFDYSIDASFTELSMGSGQKENYRGRKNTNP